MGLKGQRHFISPLIPENRYGHYARRRRVQFGASIKDDSLIFS